MTIYYVDSSALVKRYRVEPGSTWLSTLLQAADQIIISRLTVIEISAALVRRSHQSKVPPEDLRIALDLLDFDTGNSFDVLELDEPVADASARGDSPIRSARSGCNSICSRNGRAAANFGAFNVYQLR